MKLKQAIKISAFSPITKRWSQHTHIRSGVEVKCTGVRKAGDRFVAELRTINFPVKTTTVPIEQLSTLVD